MNFSFAVSYLFISYIPFTLLSQSFIFLWLKLIYKDQWEISPVVKNDSSQHYLPNPSMLMNDGMQASSLLNVLYRIYLKYVSILLVLSLTLYVVICFFSVPYSMQKFTQQKGRWSQGKSTDVLYIPTFLWSLRCFNLSSSLLRFPSLPLLNWF